VVARSNRRVSVETPSIAQVFDGMRQDFTAAKASRFKRKRNVPTQGAHGDYHYRSESDYLRVMEYARDMERNDSIVGSILTLAANVTLMNGIEVQADSGFRKLDRALQEEWDEWCLDAELCDAQGERNFYEQQHYAFRQMLGDGDILALFRGDGRLQHVEAHRIRTPSGTKKNVVHGVLLDEDRKRRQYWVTKEDLDLHAPLVKVGDIVPFDTRDPDDGQRLVAHLYNSKRFSQTRGVSAFAPCFDLCGMAEDIQFAKLVQQQIVSCFAIFKERDANYDGADDGGDDQTGSRTLAGRDDGTTGVIEGIAPGLYREGKRGETFKGFSPAVPNQEFFTQFRLTLQMIGVNLGLPLIVVLMDAAETNFSGWRGAMDVAKMGWRFNQMEMCGHYVSPVYKWRARYLIETNRAIGKLAAEAVSRGKKPFRHTTHCPVWPYVNPLQDVATDLMRLRHAMISPIQFYNERNLDPRKVVRETIGFNSRAIAAAVAAAKEINAKNPEANITWRDLWPAAPPEGVNISINASADTATANAGGAKPNAV